MDGRKIGHCKLKYYLFFCFGQSDHNSVLSITVSALPGVMSLWGQGGETFSNK